MHRTLLSSVLFVFAMSLCAPAVAENAKQEHANAQSRPTSDFKIVMPKVDTSSLTADVARQVQRGKYLVRISDCMACHTNHDADHIYGKPFSGGLPMQTPFGIVYTRNITPDTQTGIGDWTFEQFDQAVRYGLSPYGYLFAAMPYNYYNVLSRAQVLAMWEYLKRIPAVHKKNRPVDMPPPFKWRWLQVGWRIMFFKPIKDSWHYDPQHAYNPDKSKAWNRGHFIVSGPAHCGACHTPHSLLGSPQNSHNLVGSGISGEWAPNIGEAVSGVYPLEKITRVFSHARGLSGGKLLGPMLDAISNSLHYLTAEDMRAVAVYIQSVSGTPQSGPQPVPRDEVSLALGQKTYEAECAACHSTGIGGAPKVGNVSDWKNIVREPLFAVYENVWHGVSIMPPKGGCDACSSRDLTSAMIYMMHQSRPGNSAQAAEQTQAATGKGQSIARNVISLAVGKKIYKAHCAACHATGLMGAPRYGDASQWKQRLKLGLGTLHENALRGIGAMPPKGGCANCSKEQILSAVNYILAGSGGKSLLQQSSQGKH